MFKGVKHLLLVSDFIQGFIYDFTIILLLKGKLKSVLYAFLIK